MGTARVACVSGCACEPQLLDGTWQAEVSLQQVLQFWVSRRGGQPLAVLLCGCGALPVFSERSNLPMTGCAAATAAGLSANLVRLALAPPPSPTHHRCNAGVAAQALPNARHRAGPAWSGAPAGAQGAAAGGDGVALFGAAHHICRPGEGAAPGHHLIARLRSCPRCQLSGPCLHKTTVLTSPAASAPSASQIPLPLCL